MEDILLKILKEASSDKYAHILVKAHKASGKKWNVTFENNNQPTTCLTLLHLNCQILNKLNYGFEFKFASTFFVFRTEMINVL